MKTIKNTLMILGISLLTTFTTMATTNPLKAKKHLRGQIVNLIGDKIPLKANEVLSAEVSFMVNSKNEIVVLDVESKDEALIAFIKRKLNYKKIEVTSKISKKEVYTLPLKVDQP
ncbi:hypothetical protein [Tenacibaculum sp. 190524A02b]|uniref:hypothetical protein n=1 Tax=Tenacibaculum vairaonense TaxID=3137860 RepID=UPI0031FB6F9E